MSDHAQPTMMQSQGDGFSGRGRFEPGDLIGGRYRVAGSLRAGRLDEAYKVVDERDGGRLALRVLRRANRRLSPTRSLTRLVSRLAKLKHPNVARAHELSVHVESGAGNRIESVLFVTSELVEGETLGSFVRNERPLERPLALALIDDICSGLAAVHRKRVVHGDLSSAAIILCQKDGALIPVITDFALSADEDRGGFASIGSPVYRAPETIVGHRANTMSDVFSLGAIIYEILSGRIPFTGGNLLTLDYRHLQEEPRPLCELVEELDPRLDRVVSRCLSRGPEDRYADANEVRRAIRGADFWTPRTRRNVSTLSAAAALVVVMLGGSALLDRVSEMEGRRTAIETAAYRPSFAILDLALLGADTEPWIGVALGELIRDDFARDVTLRVAEHGLVQEYAGLTEPQAGVPDNELAARIRTLFDVEAIVIGNCSMDTAGGVKSVAIDLCVIDSRSGETLAAAFERGSPDALPELAARTASRLRSSIGIPEADARPIEWDPDAVRPWATGLLMLRDYRIRQGLQSLEAAAAVQPSNPQIHDALTLAWSQAGSVHRATESARRAVELSRGRSERTLERVATLSALEGDLPRAVATRIQLARTFPDRVAHTYNLIDTLLLAGATRPAAEEIRLMRLARVAVDPRIEILDARLHSQVGRVDEAASRAERGVAIARVSGSTTLEGEALIELSWAKAARGDTGSALETLEEAKSALERNHNRSGVQRVASMRAGILLRRGQLDEALAVYNEMSDWYQATGQEQGYATTLGSRATILSLRGRHEDALILLEGAIGLFGNLDDQLNLVRSLGVCGGELLALGRLDEARSKFAAAADVARRRNFAAWQGYAHTGLARVAIEKLDLREAAEQTARASSIFGSVSLGGTTASLDLVRSDLDRLQGRLAEAENRLTGIATSDRERFDRERQAELHLSLGVIAMASGRNETALALSLRAVDYYAAAGNLDRQVECLTVAYTAATRLRDDSAATALATKLDSLAPRLESPLRLLRLRLARAHAFDGARARTARMTAFERSSALHLGLLQLEAARELRDASSGQRERERWQAFVSERVRESGASLFLEPPEN